MAITLVQSTKKVVTGVNNTTLAYASNVTAGNLLVNSHAQWLGGATETITTPTDTLTHTYAGIVAQQNAGSFNSIRSFYVANCSGGADTVTFDIDGVATGDLTVVIAEFSGIATSTPLDKTNTATGTGTTASAGATGTLSQAEELIYAAACHTGNNTAWTEDSADGFSLVQENEGGSSNMPIAVQYKVTSATTDVTPNWALGASRTWIGHVGTFKAPAAAGAAPVDDEMNQGGIAAFIESW